ncbi:MAG: glycosyltransferase family 4 protein [Ardenticatenia bacterium]|nr:glycosyltransferase family 4 protein [Ardenticatenia bacterium]
MRVLLVTGEYPPMVGGIADYTYHLANALAHHGLHVAVLTRTAASSQRAPQANINLHADVQRWRLPTLELVRRRARAYDVVHLQYQAAAFDLGAAALLVPDWLRLWGGSPVVVTLHDLRLPYLFPKAGVLRPALLRRLARRAHAVVVTNHNDERRVRPWLSGRGEVRVIPLGANVPRALPPEFDRQAWRARWSVGPDDVLVVHFGMINRSKGVPTLLHAHNRLLRAGLRVKLLFLGEPVGASDPTNAEHVREVHALIEELNLGGGWTIWTGHLPPEEIAAGLAAADVVALPYRDGASLRRTTLITALAHGCAVVTTAPEAPAPPLRPDHNVVYARRNDPGDLARRLALVIRREDTRRRLARAAARLADHFDWARIAAQHRELYAIVGQREKRP